MPHGRPPHYFYGLLMPLRGEPPTGFFGTGSAFVMNR